MGPKQRQQTIRRAIKRMHDAADSLYELMDAANEQADEIGKPLTPDAWARERHFASELRERAEWWDRLTWWRA